MTAVPVITALFDGKCHRLTFDPGPSLRDILDATDYRVRSACPGLGACGLCRVRWLAGDGGPITPAEWLQLGDAPLAEGLRLACQCRPGGDATVELLSLAAPSDWHVPPAGLISAAALSPASDRALPSGIAHPLGVAVDVGTSHLTIAVSDLSSGRPLALRFGRNPQGRYGADVVTRLVAAEDPAVAARLAAAVREAIGAALADVGAREGLDLHRIGRVAIVGNTAMLALLAGRNHQLLLQPSQWTRPLDCAPADAAWASDWGIAAEADIEAEPPLGGFVGSDLLAGLVATRLTEGRAPAAFIDFGTNSEIALWTGEQLWVTAAAGGPAFETGPGRAGMPAEPGAVYRVTFDGAGRPACAILAGDRARGLCGSGLVDLVAGLRRAGTLTATGKFSGGEASYPLSAGDQTLSLDWRDVDALQRAKGAIGAGIAVLCSRAGVASADLRRVVAAGLFGRYLDVANAQAIGLLPDVAADRVELAGNTALAGAVGLLLSRRAREEAARCRAGARLVNLAREPGFDEAFLENLYLQPMVS
ncbi:MAG: ASKHA domain-containing protein [Candidatus Nitricoxidivorans perseverans]|uniref:ASKHA domain-containing protein n=1 Tax=Candidatus Nitricoxidivorans perseverans TaxID=2975601 RepID=A0AA49FN99_9PROT|nr:MAG: ASKHA domain-containing protein [Candidatus Nitricoxidivorans perseverans]